MNLIPIPLGRRLNVIYEEINAKFFGFDGEEFSDNYGFSEGRFTDAI